MDSLHSKLWELISHDFSIIDATKTLQCLYSEDGRFNLIVRCPSSMMMHVQHAAQILNVHPIFYAQDELCSLEAPIEKPPHPFWNEIERRLEILKGNHDRNPTHKNLLYYTLALLYVDLPPRRNKEFQTMLLDIEGMDDSQTSNTFDGQHFSFRRFKSVMRDKHTHVHIGKCTLRLQEALSIYLQNHPCLPFDDASSEVADFICDEDGIGYTKINSFTRLLQKALGTSCQELRRKWFTKFT